MRQNDLRPWRNLVFLTEFGLSVVLPPVLCTLAGVWIQSKTAAGVWVVLVLLAVGLISAGCNFYRYMALFVKKSRSDGDTPPSTPGEEKHDL